MATEGRQLREGPPLVMLESNDEAPIDDAQLRCSRMRSDLSVIRAVAQQVARISSAACAEGLDDQLVEEMAQRVSGLLEAAASLAHASAQPPHAAPLPGALIRSELSRVTPGLHWEVGACRTVVGHRTRHDTPGRGP